MVSDVHPDHVIAQVTAGLVKAPTFSTAPATAGAR
jgi:hypothetical protein